MILNADEFTWNGKNGASDVSDFNFLTVPMVIMLVNNKRRTSRVFANRRTHKDADGSIVRWTWVCTKDRDMVITIFND